MRSVSPVSLRWTAGLAAVFALASTNCSSTESNDGDVEDFRQQLEDGFTNNLAGFSNAIQRLVLAASGQAQTGVTITPITGGVQGSVGVDVDGNGSLETSVVGRLIFINQGQGLAGGANFTLTGITGGAPQTASGQAVVTQTGPSQLIITNGTFTTHTETRGNDLSLSDVNLSANVAGGAYNVSGTADFEFNGLDGLLTFEPVGTWFRIIVSGSGFATFTIQ